MQPSGLSLLCMRLPKHLHHLAWQSVVTGCSCKLQQACATVRSRGVVPRRICLRRLAALLLPLLLLLLLILLAALAALVCRLALLAGVQPLLGLLTVLHPVSCRGTGRGGQRESMGRGVTAGNVQIWPTSAKHCSIQSVFSVCSTACHPLCPRPLCNAPAATYGPYGSPRESAHLPDRRAAALPALQNPGPQVLWPHHLQSKLRGRAADQAGWRLLVLWVSRPAAEARRQHKRNALAALNTSPHIPQSSALHAPAEMVCRFASLQLSDAVDAR